MEGMGFHRNEGVLWHIFGVLLSRAVGNYWKSLESLEPLEPVGTVCWNLLEQGGYFVGLTKRRTYKRATRLVRDSNIVSYKYGNQHYNSITSAVGFLTHKGT